MSSLSVARRGSLQPSSLLLPDAVATTEAAERAIDLAGVAGLELDDWQQDVLRGAMGMRHDGRWSAFEAGLIVPRQNGKGTILEARQLAGLFDLGERLQIHTAHEFKTCFEHFRRIKDLVEGCDLLRRQVKIVRTGAGDQAIELTNGNRIRFLARSRSSGRGFSGDVVYLDEAFLLSDSTMGALLPALSARPNPQIWFSSSAPHMDSEVLHRVRQRGRAGTEARLFFAEWSCEPDCDPADVENWYQANPALGIRIDEELVASEFRSLGPTEFGRERLGIPELAISDTVLVPNWAELADPESRIVSHHCLALDVSPDRLFASFGAAGRREDGGLHVEAVECRPNTDWVLEVAEASWKLRHLPIRIQTGSPAASFIPLLAEAGVDVVEVSPAEHGQAVGQFLDAAHAGTLHHPASDRAPGGSSYLASAVKGAELRASGDVNLWSRRSPKVNITPLVAVTLALGGVPALVVSPYESHGLEVFG